MINQVKALEKLDIRPPADTMGYMVSSM